MHTSHIPVTETLSAATPLKVSHEAHPPAGQNGFDLAWQSEMKGAGAKPAEHHEVAADWGSNATSQGQVAPATKTKSNMGTDAAEKPGAVIGSVEKSSDIEPNTAQKFTGKGDTKLDARSHAKVSMVPPEVPAGPTKARGDAKTSAAPGSPGIANPEPEVASGTASVVTASALGVVSATRAGRVDVTQNEVNEDSVGVSSGSPAMKRESRSMAVTAEKSENAKPVGAAAGKPVAVAPQKTEKTQPVADSSCLNPVGPTVAHWTGPHNNPTGNIAAATPVLVTNHVASSKGMEVPQATPNAGSVAALNAPRMIAAGPARLDVGIFDDTHGWLRIRAELGTGGAVNASLAAGMSAHEPLRALLPEMSNYLQSEEVHVRNIAIHRSADPLNGMPATPGSDSQSRDSREQRRNTRDQNDNAAAATDVSGSPDRQQATETTASNWMGSFDRFAPGFPMAVAFTPGSGSFLNVCA